MQASRLEEARRAIRERLAALLTAWGFDGLDAQVTVELPTEKGRGDLASSVALKVARWTRVPPAEMARRLAAAWTPIPAVASVEAAGPGFLNFTLDTAWLAEVINQVRAAPQTYGNSGFGRGQRVLVEFVSANPTGPLVVVSGRAAAVGDSLARIMEAAGFAVDREFYVNDGGSQVLKLGRAVYIRLQQLAGRPLPDPWPEGVYPGEYVIDIARRWRDEHGMDLPAVPEEALWDRLGMFGAELLRSQQEAALLRFGVRFDRWYSERALRDAGAPGDVVARLAERGHIVWRDGAQWFVSTAFGDDKDRVVVKSDGSYTYLVPDAAYHADKFERGYDYVIDLLGPDHHGYIGRIRAITEALGYPSDRLEIIIVQLVRLVRRGEAVRMSKRGGEFVALEDLLDEVGVDPARYFFLERAPDTPLDFDLDLAALKDNDNPVYYVQYAAARIYSLFAQARERNLDLAPLDLTRLDQPLERTLMLLLARFPDEVEAAAVNRAPHYLPRYLTELAGEFHAFYRQHRILEEAPAVRTARLALCEAVLAVLSRGLDLMGVSVPERM